MRSLEPKQAPVNGSEKKGGIMETRARSIQQIVDHLLFRIIRKSTCQLATRGQDIPSLALSDNGREMVLY